MQNVKGLNEMSNSIYQANKAKGFWDKERNVGEMLMLVTSELAEAMEAHRGRGNTLNREKFEEIIKRDPDNFKIAFEECIKDTFQDEIADSMIRLFDMAGGLSIDLDFHIKNKLAYNATRQKLHGKKY